MPKRKAEYEVHTCCVCETEIQVEECVYWPLRYGTRGKRLHLYLHSKCRKTFAGQIEDRKAAACAAAKSAICQQQHPEVHKCCVCDAEIIEVPGGGHSKWTLRYGNRGKRLHLYVHDNHMCRNTFIGQIEDRKADARAEAKSTIRPTLVEELTTSGPPGPPEAPDQHVPPCSEAPHLKPDPFSREERLRLFDNLTEELAKAPTSMDLLHFKKTSNRLTTIR